MSYTRFRPRVGVVTAVSSDSCTVLINDGEVSAYLNDQTLAAVIIGAVVTLLPVGDTYEVISTRTGSGGGGGLILGSELIANGSFEYGDTVPNGWGWWPFVAGNYFAARDTTPGTAASGSARMLVTLSPDATVDPVVHVINAPVRVDPGVAYQGTAQIKASAIESSLIVTYRVITAATADQAGIGGTGAVVTDIATITAPGAAYQLLSGTLTVPAGHHYARLFLRSEADNAMAASVDVSWDLVSLRQRITS